jgi:signal transduction histidine kinase
MGTPTLEAQLRNRVLKVAVPALLAVAIASVAITSWVLDAADRGAAQARAEDVLRVLRSEFREGDTIEVAAAEALQSVDTAGVRVVVRGPNMPWRSGAQPMLTGALALGSGACARMQDGESVHWVACLVTDEPFASLVAIRVEEHRAAVRTLGRATFGVVIVALLGLVWAVRRAVRSSLQSVAKLAAWSEEIGDADAAAPPPAETEEIERLVRSFDRLVRRLLEALARERSITAHIAHELRTPLTSMLAELERLAEGPHDPALDRMRGDATRLARVVESILVLSSQSATARSKSVVNVADLAREATTGETVVEAPDEALVEGDERLVALALGNLLDNARTYSGHDARRIRVSREGESVRLAVIDDGPGVDEAARAKMFDRYWRAQEQGSGTGLGLALVRAVAERHGGTAEARPNTGGPGLEVSMTMGPVVGWHEQGG